MKLEVFSSKGPSEVQATKKAVSGPEQRSSAQQPATSAQSTTMLASDAVRATLSTNRSARTETSVTRDPDQASKLAEKIAERVSGDNELALSAMGIPSTPGR